MADGPVRVLGFTLNFNKDASPPFVGNFMRVMFKYKEQT